MSTRRNNVVSLATVALLAVGGTAGVGLAQAQSTGGVPAPLAPPIPSVQGVKSKAPSPIGIGRKGTLLNRNGTLLPPAPARRSFTPSPLPRPIVTVPSDGLRRRVDVGPGYIGVPTIGHSGSGLTVDGRYDDDKFNLRFHIGSGYTVYPWWKPWNYDRHAHRRRHHHHLDGYTYPWISGFNYRNYYDNYDYYENRPIVYGQIDPFVMYTAALQAAKSAAAVQQLASVREPTPLERADALLAMGETSRAVEGYRKYLEDVPDDANVMRSLAIALMEDRRLDEAVSVLALAYEKNPRLARTPIDAGLFAADAADLRRRVNSAVSYANRVRSGSAWLLAAALVQAEGRDAVALSMVDRARGMGLAAPVADELTAVLKR